MSSPSAAGRVRFGSETPAKPPPRAPRPFRALFPLGVGFAVLGAGVWALFAAGVVPYPGPLHRTLMIQGFQFSFVTGFLLTAMPGLTRGEACRAWELAAVAICQIMFGAAALAGWAPLAHGAFLCTLLVVLAAFSRRVIRGGIRPPDEVVFAGFGLLLGLAGGVLGVCVSLGLLVEPAPRFTDRLLALGMVLSLVLGVGGLLVPTFAGIRDLAALPTPTTRPRLGRRALYGAAIAGLAGSFVLDALRLPDAGRLARALAAMSVVLLAWKIWRRPRLRALSAWMIWSAAWLVVVGLASAAALPRFEIAALHVTFVGGFGLLTLGVASRVVVAHGGVEETRQRALVSRTALALLGLVLGFRVGAELLPSYSAVMLGAAGVLWSLVWISWAIGFELIGRLGGGPRSSTPGSSAA